MEKLEKQAKREDGELLILTPNNGAAAGLSTLPLGLSTDKVSNTSSPTQEDGELFRPEDKLSINKEYAPIFWLVEYCFQPNL